MQLVVCNRFSCRLSESACVKRYRQSAEATRVYNAKLGSSSTHAEGCRGCAQGAGRAGQ